MKKTPRRRQQVPWDWNPEATVTNQYLPEPSSIEVSAMYAALERAELIRRGRRNFCPPVLCAQDQLHLIVLAAKVREMSNAVNRVLRMHLQDERVADLRQAVAWTRGREL